MDQPHNCKLFTEQLTCFSVLVFHDIPSPSAASCLVQFVREFSSASDWSLQTTSWQLEVLRISTQLLLSLSASLWSNHDVSYQWNHEKSHLITKSYHKITKITLCEAWLPIVPQSYKNDQKTRKTHLNWNTISSLVLKNSYPLISVTHSGK